MRLFNDMSDKDVERLLAGSVPDREEDLDGVARFFAGVARDYPETSTDAYEATHVGAMLETARAAALGSAGDRESAATLGWPYLRGLFARPSARVAGVAVAVVLVFGGTAYAGILPVSVQTAVAHAARAFGITLPDPATGPNSNPPRAIDGNVNGRGPAARGLGVQGGSEASGSVNAPKGSSNATQPADAHQGKGAPGADSKSSPKSKPPGKSGSSGNSAARRSNGSAANGKSGDSHGKSGDPGGSGKGPHGDGDPGSGS